MSGAAECAVPGCSGSAPSWSVLCDLHRGRLAAGAQLTDGEPLPRVCSTEGCDGTGPWRRGLCHACYSRAHRAGTLPPLVPRVPKPKSTKPKPQPKKKTPKNQNKRAVPAPEGESSGRGFGRRPSSCRSAAAPRRTRRAAPAGGGAGVVTTWH